MAVTLKYENTRAFRILRIIFKNDRLMDGDQEIIDHKVKRIHSIRSMGGQAIVALVYQMENAAPCSSHGEASP